MRFWKWFIEEAREVKEVIASLEVRDVCHSISKATSLTSLISLTSSFLLLISCARIGSPDGGPYDETPPKVVSTSPKFGSSNVKSAKKITIEFDEIVKVENAMENVVISPPQIEQPEISATGRKVIIDLIDSLKPNMTYTIDFSDAIVDNNEGNPYGDYAFTFSTGEQVDTFQMSGHVLEAQNLEPIKGILVGLYKLGNDSIESLPDSVFRTIPFERISRTDSKGHFVVKGLAPGNYRAFALKDQNQNYIYDQPAEMVAFSERILSPSSRPDVRPDTVWHDSIHYDSIVYSRYTHFFPDDIALLAFESALQNRYLLKSERLTPQMFTLYFTSPSDTLPHLKGLNFDAEDAFVIDATPHNDTINYWVRDSLIYNLDTLTVQMDFYATDTTGVLALTTDTLWLVSKLTKEKIAKEQQEKYDEWVKEYKQRLKEERRAAKRAEKENAENADKSNASEDSETTENADNKTKRKKKKKDDDEDVEIPPMPEEFLDYKTSNLQSMVPDKNIDFTFSEPLDSVDLSKIHLSIQVDTLFQPVEFRFRQLPHNIKAYRLYAEWEPDTTYQLEIDTAAFRGIYGKRVEASKRSIRMKRLDTLSTLFVTLQGGRTNSPPESQLPTGTWDGALVQLIDGSDKTVKTLKVERNKADFYFVEPSTYYLRLIDDLNGNGQWDTGDYDKHLQPEPVYYHSQAITLKAQWEISQDWNPTQQPIAKQKPLKITKQKPDKAKLPKNRNAERLRMKKQSN